VEDAKEITGVITSPEEAACRIDLDCKSRVVQRLNGKSLQVSNVMMIIRPCAAKFNPVLDNKNLDCGAASATCQK
jgi:hypothetical protein